MQQTKIKSKILLVADSPNWAYHDISNFIINNLSSSFDFYLDFTCFYSTPKLPFFKALRRKYSHAIARHRYQRIRADRTYDLVFFSGFYMRKLYPEIKARKVLPGIYTASFPPNGIESGDEGISQQEFARKYLAGCHAVVAGNSDIPSLYAELPIPFFWANGNCAGFENPVAKKFHQGQDFVVGWSGNATRPIKGFYDYVVPAVTAAAKQRPGIRLKVREFGPRETLPRFYDDLDVVLIASESEAGPALFSEAALSNVPAISTAIGFPAMIIKDGVNGFLVERKVSDMVDRLIRLYDDRELLWAMSQRIRKDYEEILGDEVQVRRWKNIFDTVLAEGI